ncbi:MAG: hypothetical protein BroJett015_36630 [Chloroflexota bacterium]|nr:hypothetical protein [Ardenticatenaceae bacterium]GIK58000.1 MAG: hypothetical protein BroJett015_36630 [Chloroflexota bacterium]
MAAQMVSSSQLQQVLNRHFNSKELQELSFDLGIEYENLGGGSKSEKVLELIGYCERHGRTDDLINTIQRARPNIDWNTPDPSPQGQQGPARKTGGFDPAQASEQPYQQTIQPDHIASEGEAYGPALEISPNPFQTITTHTSTLLTERHGVRIYGLVTRRPWNLPVDAFVLPLGFGKEYSPGLLAQELENALASVQVDSPYKAFAQTINIRTPPELLPTAPFILMHNDTDFWTVPGTERKVIAATANDGHGRTIAHTAAAATAIVQLAIANNLRRLTIPALGAGTGGLPEQEVALAMVDAILTAVPPRSPADPAALDEIIFTTIKPEVLAALRQRFIKRPQAAVNDEPVGRDLLQVETAVYALAEMCMLNDLHPPLAVGVLGGWGSGKSFVMHLMQERIAHLRGRPATTNFPYIGHVYQIKFDAWTYAKSNLWASLMQTIFYELNAQLTREREVAKTLAGIPETADSQALTAEQEAALAQVLRDGGAMWEALAQPDLKSRQVQDIVNFAAELDKKVQSQELLWAELRLLKGTELNDLRQTETELAVKQAALEQSRLELQAVVDKEIVAEARQAAWLPLQNAFKQQFGAATKTIKQMFTAVEPTDTPSLRQTFTNTAALWQMVRNNPTEFAAFLLLALFLVTVLWVSENVTIQLPGLVLTISSISMAFLRSYDKWLNLIRQSFVAYQLQVEAERDRLADGRDARLQQKLAEQTREFNQSKQIGQPVHLPAANIPALEEEIATLEAKAKRQRQRVGITATYVSLLDFVSSRLDEAIYEKELGLMHQVQRDLRELSESLTVEGHKLFPRGQARVILYIDDLDRCPPLRVVEVLEAVQLLLKTDLFIVVLAIDVRFITRALETVYKGILTRRGAPSGLDYIEKIIQIPYGVQPIEEAAVDGYLGKQVVVTRLAPAESEAAVSGSVDTAVSDTGALTDSGRGEGEPEKREAGDEGDNGRQPETDLPVQAIEISPEEYERMQNCCRQVTMTPRAVKRLANVYKLLKIIWYRDGSEPNNLAMIEVIMAMLALSERYPNQMRDLFEGMAHQIRGNAAQKIAAYIENQLPENEKDTYTAQEWRQLVADMAVLMPDIPVNQVDLKTFNLVRSFCFVGDIGYDPGEMMQAAARQLANSTNPPLQPAVQSSEKQDEG